MNLNTQSNLFQFFQTFAQKIEESNLPKSVINLFSISIQILDIDENTLRYFPNSIQPYPQTFYKLIQLKLQSRQQRQEQVLYVASAFYRCLFNQQILFYSQYHNYLSKIQVVPQNIKILQDLFSVRSKLIYTLRNSRNYDEQNQLNHIQIITPTDLLKICISMMQKFRNIQIQKQSSSNLENYQIKLHQWKYKACYICCCLILQKQLQVNLISFIKQTKQLSKQDLISQILIIKLYVFFIQFMIKNNNEVQHYGHFQIQLQSLKKKCQKKTNFSFQILAQIQLTLQKARKHTKRNIQGKDSKIIKDYQKCIQKISLQEVIKKKSILNRQNDDLMIALQKRKFMYRNLQSTTIFKIKSLKNSIKNSSRNSLTLKNSPNQTQKLQKKSVSIINTNRVNSSKKMLKPQSYATARLKLAEYNQNRKHKLKNSSRQKQMLSKITKAMYMSIRDNGMRDLVITTMGLENQMFMIPDSQIQKPKITFQQILLQTKINQKSQSNQQPSRKSAQLYDIQNNSQLLISTYVQLTILMVMNQKNIYFKIVKKQQCQNQYTCFLIQKDFSAKVFFQDFQHQYSFKFNVNQMKKLVTSSELYFQLIQETTDHFRAETALSMIIQAKDLSSLRKSSPQQYYSHLKLFTNILQISNFLTPYFSWYFTKHNKINGTILEKRKNVKISDTLKFSIGLQFLKKNSYQYCINSAKTVRNKKGLRECLIYLSQGRQIILKLISRFKGKYIFNILCVNQSIFHKFLLGQNKSLFDQFQIQLQNKQFYLQNFSLKKKSKINLRQYFGDQQCNQILIRNTKENFINNKYLIKLIKIVQRINTIQRREYEFQYQDDYNSFSAQNFNHYHPSKNIFLQSDFNFQTIQERRITLILQDDNKLDFQFRVNLSLLSFLPFLRNFSQVYQHSFNYQIQNKSRYKIKISKKFFNVEIYELFLKRFFIIVKRVNTNCCHNIIILSKNQLDSIFPTNYHQFQSNSPLQFNKQNLNNINQQESFNSQIKMIDTCRSGGQKSIKNQLQSKNESFKIRSQREKNIFQLILQQNSLIRLQFFQTSYYNKISFKVVQKKDILNQQLFILNQTTKGIVQKTNYQYYQIILKKIYRKNQQWIYFCVSLNFSLFFWRIDIYLPSNQQKYVVFIPYQVCEHQYQQEQQSNKSKNIQKQQKLKGKTSQKEEDQFQLKLKHLTPYLVWKKLIESNNMIINFEKFQVLINSKSNNFIFKLYQTFGVLNLYQNDFHLDRKRQQTVQLLLCNTEIEFLLLNYEQNRMLKGEVDQNPLNLFTNIFAEYSQKQFKVKIYNNIFIRVYNKILTNKIAFEEISIEDFQVQQQQQEEDQEKKKR